MTTEESATPDLLAAYREALVRWGEESEAFGQRTTANRANKLFVQAHSHFKLLRQRHEGREGIAALMADANPYVREVAASHSLLWDPTPATRVLEELEAADGLPWQIQIGAKYTLKEWRAGKLSFDW